MGFEDELRLAYAVGINVVVLVAAYRFAARRVAGADAAADTVRRLIDAGLIYYLVQYVALGALGLVGLLSPWTIGPLALMLSAALWTASGRRRTDAESVEAATPSRDVDRVVIFTALAFVATYALSYVHFQRNLAPTANDALTYHLPAAVQWLQTGRIGLFPTWFFNPANAYSPLGASLYVAWLLAPMGNDSLARFVQLGPLLLMFLVMVEIGRLLGARGATAALVAAACVMTRSFVNQVVVPKDDLFLTVFCLIAVMSLAPARASEPWAPWRLGSALGLLLATKYTAMFSLPILLVMADAPLRRRWLIGLAVALVLAGPWYVRNALLTGNPLYPIDMSIGGVRVLNGLFATARSKELGVWTLLGGRSFFGPPTLVMFLLLAAWAAALLALRKAIVRDALARAIVIGSMLSIALFMLASPYPEVRFVYPAIALLFACAAAGAARMPRGVGVIVAAVVLLVVVATTLKGKEINPKPTFAALAVVVAGLALASLWLTPRQRSARAAWAVAGCVAVLVLAGYAFVYWKRYLREYAAGRIDTWGPVYREIASGWEVIDRDVPAGSVIAYADTFLVYPLQGFELRNQVVYVPARPGVHHLHDLPRAAEPLPGERIPDHFAEQAVAGADEATWRRNLLAAGADVVFVAKRRAGRAPELAFIARRPAAFEVLYDDAAVAVYRVRDAAALRD